MPGDRLQYFFQKSGEFKKISFSLAVEKLNQLLVEGATANLKMSQLLSWQTKETPGSLIAVAIGNMLE